MTEEALVEELADEIIARLTTDSVELLLARWGSDIDDMDPQDLKSDLEQVMTGDDPGCLGEDEMTAENVTIIWLRERLRRAITDARIEEHRRNCGRGKPPQPSKKLCCDGTWDCPRVRELREEKR